MSDAAVEQRAWPDRSKSSISSGKVMPPVTLMALVVGPMEPATKRGLAEVENSSAAWRASCAAGRFKFVGLALEAVFGQHQRVPPKVVGFDDVGAGREIGAVDVEHHVGPRAHQVFRCSPRAPGRRNRPP